MKLNPLGGEQGIGQIVVVARLDHEDAKLFVLHHLFPGPQAAARTDSL